jgi:thiamine pyrophosphokinase
MDHPGLRGLEAQLVVAVDSGLHLAHAAGWAPDRVIGDLDSVDAASLDAARAAGCEVVEHPTDKDLTDLELALDDVVSDGAERVVVIGADAGRMDHLLGGALILCAPRYATLRIEAWLGRAVLWPVHAHVTLHGRPGRLVSIVAVHGPASGVRTDGLRWPLRGERLEPGSGRGLSNELLDEVAHVSVEHGCLAVLLPEESE